MDTSAWESGDSLTPENVSGRMYRCNLPPFFPPSLGIHDSINKVQAGIAIATALVGLPLNIYLFVIILKYKSLHQKTLFLSLQIIAIEILYHAVIPATILASGITGTWVFGQVTCNLTGMVHDAFPMFRFSMTLVLTLDRFIFVFAPRYYRNHGGKLALVLSGCVWILSLVRALVPLYGVLDCYTYIPVFKTCTTYTGCSKSCEYFIAANVIFIVFTGIFLPLALYTIIFIQMRSVDRQEKVSQKQPAVVRHQQQKKILVTVFFLMLSIAGSTAPATIFYIVSLFYRVANSTSFTFYMLVGRTLFNLIPVFDGIAFTRFEGVRKRLNVKKKCLCK